MRERKHERHLNQLPHVHATDLGWDEAHPKKSRPHRLFEQRIVRAHESKTSFLGASLLVDNELRDHLPFDA